MRRLPLFLLGLTLLTGCVATGTKVTEEQLFRFQRGTTSYFDVVAQLGKPTQTTRHADGTREAWYTYAQAQLKWVNFVPIADRLVGGATAETTSVYLTFDPHDRLVTYSVSQGQSQSGYGLQSGARQ
jgi:hypothetical protein